MNNQSQRNQSDPYHYPNVPLLLCHDIVEAGIDTQERASWRTCIHNAGLLLNEARRRHWLIVHAFQAGVAPEPVKDVRPLPDEPVFQCQGPSAFSSRGLRAFIASNSPSQILLVGRSFLPIGLANIAANADIGLPISVISDAISLSKQAAQSQPRTGEAAWEEPTGRKVPPNFASITTTSQVLNLGATLALLN
jgi:hypothetical protein